MSNPGRKPEVTDDEILAVFRSTDDPVLTAGEVAEGLSIGRRAVHDRLADLHDRGVIRRKKIGPRTVWWPADIGGNHAPAAPLRELVGALDADVADEARERSRAWRDSFDEEMTPDGG